jgi:hypothetical protein
MIDFEMMTNYLKPLDHVMINDEAPDGLRGTMATFMRYEKMPETGLSVAIVILAGEPLENQRKIYKNYLTKVDINGKKIK